MTAASTASAELDAWKKAGAVKGPAGPVLRSEDLRLWLDAQGYLDAAKRVLDEARQRANELAAAERERGYTEGWEAGSKDLFALLAQTKLAIDAYHAQLEANLRELAIQVIREVIDGLDASDAVALAVRKALKTPSLGSEVTLYVAPEVLPHIGGKLEGQLTHSTPSVITLREDAKLSPTDCRLVSEFCSIDLSIDRQLALLADSLRAANIGVRT